MVVLVFRVFWTQRIPQSLVCDSAEVTVVRDGTFGRSIAQYMGENGP